MNEFKVNTIVKSSYYSDYSRPLMKYYARRYTGKLLLRKEISIHKQPFQQLISSGYFLKTSSIDHENNHLTCRRCGNGKRSLFASMPCHSCGTNQIYCRKCIEMGKVIACEPLYYWTGQQTQWKSVGDSCTWKGKLTDAQQSAANRISIAIKHRERELLVWAVCGAGKTEMLFPGIAEGLYLGKRICIATPRTDVVRELLPRFKQAFSTISIQGLYGGNQDETGSAQLVISTTHQLIRYREAFDILIIDEIDAFPFHADPSLPFATNRALKKAGTMIYLTATPRKQHQLQMAKNKLPHLFVPIRFHGHPLPIPTFKMCYSLKKDLLNNKPPQPLLTWIANRANPKRQILLFIPTIPMAEEMKSKLAKRLVNEKLFESTKLLRSVHADDPDREETITLFRENKLSVLLTTTILERGVTFQSIDVAVLDAGHHVFDEAALVQIAGRAGRSPIDPEGEVVFFHDGKTIAMVEAVQSIISMNRRGGFNLK